MYLQLAEDGDNYTPIETNQGTIFVRNDLAEETLLSAKGKGLQIAGKIVGTAAKFVPLPGAAAVGNIAGKVLTTAGQARAGGGSAIQGGARALPPGTGAKIASKLKGALGRMKAKGAPIETTTLPETITARTAAEEVMQEPKQSFFRKYRTPLLIGGGVIVLGTAAYLLTRKKRK